MTISRLLRRMRRRIHALRPGRVWRAARWVLYTPRRVVAKRTALGTLPDFLLIGAQRCGTETLYDLLCRHPDIRAAIRKEVHFFDRNYERGIRWYRQFFPLGRRSNRAFRTGEATPYYLFHPEVPARVAADLPTVRLIALLREPTDRAWSHYHHEVSRGFERRPFEQAIEEEPGPESTDQVWDHQHFSYLGRGEYAGQLERWLEHFSREQLLVLRSEDFFADPQPVLDRILAHLGLPAWTPRRLLHRNRGLYQGEMADSTRDRLREHYRPQGAELIRLLGPGFGGWDRHGR